MYIKSEKDRQNAALFDTDKLRNSKVLLIGLGGLGSPVAYALAGAGIGKLTLCDKDTVSESNLNRQTLYTAKDIGKSKAKTACDVLSSFAPDCDIDFIDEEVNESNADFLVSDNDLVILAADNNRVRFDVNKACAKQGVMLLNVGIANAFGSIYLYIPGKTPCLACVLGETESNDKRTCAACCGAVGSLAAMRALSALCGADIHEGKIAVIDCLELTVDLLPIRRRNGCDICGGEQK